MHGALAEGALSGFELEFEPEWIDRCPADAELAFGFAWQHATGQQTTIRGLSRVVAARDPCTTAHLLRQLAHRVEEVHRVSAQLVDALESGQRGRFKPLVTDEATHDRPVLLLDKAAVVLTVRSAAGKGDAVGRTVVHQ